MASPALLHYYSKEAVAPDKAKMDMGHLGVLITSPLVPFFHHYSIQIKRIISSPLISDAMKSIPDKIKTEKKMPS